jgi:hypothetical protein
MPTLRVWDFFYKHVTPNGVAAELKGKNQKVRSDTIHRVEQTFWQTSVATRFTASNKRFGQPLQNHCI